MDQRVSLGQTAVTQAVQEWWAEAGVVPAVGQTPLIKRTIRPEEDLSTGQDM